MLGYSLTGHIGLCASTAFRYNRQEQAERSDSYRHISEVEGGPVRKSPMEVKEINNRSTQHTIHDIAERTTKDQAVSHRFETWPLLAQHAAQPSRNDQTQRDEKVTLPAASVRQKAECRAGIQDMDEVEEGA